MKKFQTIVAIALMVLTMSCKKEAVTTPVIENPTPAFTKKMTQSVSVYSDGTKETTAQSYDTQGRLSVYQDDDDITTFDYATPQKMFATQKKIATGVTNLLYECDLNDKGLATKVVIKYPDGKVYGQYNYAYDAAGYMSYYEGIHTGSSFKFAFEIVNGNLVSTKRYDDNVHTQTSQYSYDKVVNNTFEWRLGGYWGSSMFGKKTKNVATEGKTTKLDGTLTWHYKTSYETDAQGYIVKQQINYPMTNFQENTTFTYQ